MIPYEAYKAILKTTGVCNFTAHFADEEIRRDWPHLPSRLPPI